jgi:hypothetical protein
MKKKKERKKRTHENPTHPPSIFLYKNCFAPVAQLMVTLAAQNCHKKNTLLWVAELIVNWLPKIAIKPSFKLQN